MNSDFLADEVKVSIVVLTYNQEATIARTLDSILMQNRDFPIEIIIGDDASKDHTEEICKEYAARYPDIVRYYRNESNIGLLDNYYNCILRAKGEYIADVAGDDFWIDKDKIKKQVEILDKEHNVNLVCSDWKIYDESTAILSSPWKDGKYPYQDLFKDKNLTLKLLSHLNPSVVHLCTSMYRKNSFLELYNKDPFPFRNKDFLIEDLQLIVLLSTIGEFKFIDSPTLAYSVHSNSFSGTKDSTKIFDLYYASLKLTRYLAEKTGITHTQLNNVYSRLIHFITTQAFHAKDKSRIQKVKKLIEDWEFEPIFKTRILLKISNNYSVWRISQLIWTLLKDIKR